MIARRLKLNREMEVVLLVAALSCGFTSGLTWPNDAIGSKEPDRILFDRAVSAAERHRFDLANLTLQTLINTYPDSKYAAEAERLLGDPRIAQCEVSGNMQWSSGSPSTCEVGSTSSAPPAGLDLFPPPDPD